MKNRFKGVRALYVTLLFAALILLSGVIAFAISQPSLKYDFAYYFPQSYVEGVKDMKSKQVSLSNGESLSGRIVVKSGEALLLVTSQRSTSEQAVRVVDSGVISANGSFAFSEVSDWTFTDYTIYFFISGDAVFYSNRNPRIIGAKQIPLSPEEEAQRVIQLEVYRAWEQRQPTGGTLVEMLERRRKDPPPPSPMSPWKTAIVDFPAIPTR